MSLTKFCTPSETALRQLFNRQLFLICVLSLNERVTPNSTVSHEFLAFLNLTMFTRKFLSLSAVAIQVTIFRIPLSTMNSLINTLLKNLKI